MRLIIAAFLLLFASPAFAEDIGSNTVCFVPGLDDCALVAAAEIGKATKTLDVEQFQLTEPRIAQAILDAKARGVTVRLIVDKKAPGEKNGQTATLAAAGIPTWVDYHPHIAHNKVIIIDGAEFEGGSFNMTTNADLHNAENMLIIRDPALAAAYERNFERRLAASETLDEYEAAHQTR